jgi:hypothetical protein
MIKIKSALAGLLSLVAVTSAFAQSAPATLPFHSLYGRLGAQPGDTGPGQAIPFANILPNLVGTQSANQVYAGPGSGPVALPTFRALVGADLPAPSASTLGGVQSLTCSTSNWFRTLSTAGVFGCSQPNFTDLAGSIAGGQIPNGTITSAMIASGTIVDANISASAAIAGTKVNLATITAPGTVPTLPNDGTKFLNGLGAYASPIGQGQMVLLNTLTANNTSNTLTDTTSLTATYSNYEIVFENLLPATNNITFGFLVHSGGAYQNTNYVGVNLTTGSSSGITNPTTQITISQPSTVQNASGGLSGHLRIFTPSGSTAPKPIVGMSTHNNATLYVLNQFSGAWTNSNAAVDGFAVITSAGFIVSGVVKIYGIQ